MGLRISQSAKIYADALLNLNIDDKKLIDDISNILDAITNSNDLDSVLNNPVIENNSKFEIINEIFRSKIDDKILEFIKILIEKKRISQLPEIKASLIEKLNSKNNIKLVQITSAIELNDYYKTK
ncbi:ATP synthase F1 subunit delta, partial [bacterium]|nr:ATP synthase F1 subunit delta [bacterium]